MMRLFSLIGALVLTAVFTAPVKAEGFGDDTSSASQFGANNPQLKAVLSLQYQMQVLRRMIEREKAVNAMLVSAVAIGASDPAIPKPDQALCAQVPANIPCAQAFKDMYPDFSVEQQTSAAPVTTASAAIPSLPPGSLQALPGDAQPALGGALYWADVTCMNQKCSAILTPNPQDPRARYRVVQGETLPDGATVSSISFNGVTLEDGKKTITLNPAPKA